MDVSDYYTKSFESLKENLNIVIPSLVGTVLVFAVVFIVILLTVFGALGLGFDVSRLSPAMIGTLIAILFLTSIVVGLILSFVSAATIGMAKKIIKTKTADLDVAWKSGKKYFIRVFLVKIIIALAALILSIPLFLGLFLMISNQKIGFVVLAIGAIILLIGVILLGLSFLVVEQSIVVGKRSVIDSLRDSFEIFWSNKLAVFLVFVINIAIAVGISWILGLIPYIGSILNMIVSIVLTPYFILVLTYLYMDLKGRIPPET